MIIVRLIETEKALLDSSGLSLEKLLPRLETVALTDDAPGTIKNVVYNAVMQILKDISNVSIYHQIKLLRQPGSQQTFGNTVLNDRKFFVRNPWLTTGFYST